MKHKHKWQFVRMTTQIPSGKQEAQFICECGLIKDVEVKDE